MLRDKNLIPLSHQHQHALALCVRIERASPIADADVAAWQAEIAQQFQDRNRDSLRRGRSDCVSRQRNGLRS